MRDTVRFFILLILAGGSFLQADVLPLGLRLKQNQDIKQLTTIGFDVYLEVSDELVKQIKKENASQPSEQTTLLLQGLTRLSKDKPACNGSMQFTQSAKVTEDKQQYYSISMSNKVDKLTFRENLLNNFTLTFNADKPDKNFSNLPVPVDFKELDHTLNLQETIIAQIAKDGTLIDIENLHQLILKRSAESGWSKEQTAQVSAGLGFASLLIPQLKISSHLTGIRLPDSPKKIGESWIQPYITLPPMFEPAIPQEYLPLLGMLNQKITFLEKKGDLATFSVEFPAAKSHTFPIPEKEVEIGFKGDLLRGTMSLDTKTGLIVDAEFISDFTVSISRTKNSTSPPQDKLSNEVVYRLVANVGIEAQSNL